MGRFEAQLNYCSLANNYIIQIMLTQVFFPYLALPYIRSGLILDLERSWNSIMLCFLFSLFLVEKKYFLFWSAVTIQIQDTQNPETSEKWTLVFSIQDMIAIKWMFQKCQML